MIPPLALRRKRVSLGLILGLIHASAASAQLVVAAEVNPGIAKPGEQLDVRITVANQGASDVAAVTLNLLLPNELDQFPLGVATPTGAAGSCIQVVHDGFCSSGETLSWTLGTITARQSVQVSLTPIVAAGAIGPIVFTPTLNSGPSASATVTVNAARALDLSVHESWDAVAAGDALIYTLHFGNTSTTNTAPGALLRLPVPANTAFASASDGGGLNAGAIEWSLGTLQPGESGTRTATVTTNAGLGRGSLLLAQAELTDTSPQTARARAVTEVDGLEALEIGMALNPDPAAAGEQLQIELTLTNTGASALSTVTIVLRWPQQIDPPFFTQGTSWSAGSCAQIVVSDDRCTAGEFAVWSLPGGTLNAGQSVTVSYAAGVAAGTPDGALVDFEATALSSGADNRAAVGRAVAVDSTSALELSLHEAVDAIAAGDEVVYTLHFGNASGSSAPSAVLAFTLPTGTTFVSASDGGTLGSGVVQWSLGTLAAGQSGARTVTIDTNAALARGALVLAEAKLSDASVPAQFARARSVTEIDGLDALEIGMAVGPDPASVGEQLQIELTVTNTSASAISTVTVVLRWPQHLDPPFFTQATSFGAGSCSQIVVNDDLCTAGEFAIWSPGTLNAGQSATVSYSAVVASGTPDGALIDFEAGVASTGADDRATVGRAISVDSTRQLRLGLHEAADPVAAGDDVVYTLSFGNTSTVSTAPSAMLRFPVPDGTTFVSASGGGALNAGVVEWALGTLAPRALGTRTVTVDTDPGLVRGALLGANASLTDAALPPQLGRASAVTEIDGLEALETVVAFTNDPAPGIEVDVTVTNTDVASHTGVTLVLRVPDDTQPFLRTSVTPVSGGCNQVVATDFCEPGEFLFWNIATLTAGQNFTVTIPQMIIGAPSGGYGGLFELHAVALGSGADDRAVDKVVPEPGFAASLVAGIALLAGLVRRRR